MSSIGRKDKQTFSLHSVHERVQSMDHCNVDDRIILIIECEAKNFFLSMINAAYMSNPLICIILGVRHMIWLKVPDARSTVPSCILMACFQCPPPLLPVHIHVTMVMKFLGAFSHSCRKNLSESAVPAAEPPVQDAAPKVTMFSTHMLHIFMKIT